MKQGTLTVRSAAFITLALPAVALAQPDSIGEGPLIPWAVWGSIGMVVLIVLFTLTVLRGRR